MHPIKFDLRGQAVLDEGAKVLYVRGRSDAETLVDFARDSMNTSSAWDDELVVTMTVYADGPDSIEMFTFPYFDTSGTGGTGGFTTTNEPTDTSVGIHLLPWFREREERTLEPHVDADAGRRMVQRAGVR